MTGSTRNTYVPLLTLRLKFKYAPYNIGVDFMGSWELSQWEVDLLRVDLVGVDFVRVDHMGGHQYL